MPFAIRNGVRLHWSIDGADDRPPLLLLNSIGTDLSLWDAALPDLLPDFRVLRLDTRGHGSSEAPDGDYSLGMLADDVVAVMDAAGVARAAVAGVSLGGMIAMELALRRPERVGALVLVCTSAGMDSAAWSERVDLVRREGTAAIADLAMSRFLSPGFARANPSVGDRLRRSLVGMADAGYAGCGCAIRDMVLSDRLAEIAVPTLVIAGDRDTSTPFAGHGDRIAAAVPNARVEHLDTAHLAPVEAPAALAASIRHFLLGKSEIGRAADLLRDMGMAKRRHVLGDEWVDASLAARTAFNADFQDMITRTAWAEVWSRPGLDDRTRRLLVLAITASLGRWEEFDLHVRASLTRRDVTRDELKEVLMQVAVYAGVPAANTAFARAGTMLAELDQGPEAA